MKLSVLGIGGCGISLLHELQDRQLPFAYGIAISRHAIALKASSVENRIHLDCPSNSTGGVSTSVYMNRERLLQEVRGSVAAVLVADMGDVYSSQAMTGVAEIMCSHGVPLWAIVSSPLPYGDNQRIDMPLSGLSSYVDALFLVDGRRPPTRTGLHTLSMTAPLRAVTSVMADMIERLPACLGQPMLMLPKLPERVFMLVPPTPERHF